MYSTPKAGHEAGISGLFLTTWFPAQSHRMLDSFFCRSFRLPRQCFHLVVDYIARFLVHAIDEQHTIEMIDFMLNAARKESVAFQHMRHAALVLEIRNDRIRTLDVARSEEHTSE